MADTDVRTRFVPTPLGRLRVRAVGRGAPVVLWHSMFVDATSWDRVVPALATDRRLLLVDGPSSGGSDRLTRASDIAGCALAAGALLDGLADEIHGPVDWIGSAWGGHVGMQLAATQPERIRRLVAISAPTDPIDAGLRRRLRVLLPLFRAVGARGPVRSAILDTLLTDASRASDPVAVELILGPLRRADREGMALAVETAIVNRTDLAWAAARIRRPVLFVTTDDRGEWTPERAREVSAGMTDAREVTVSGSRVLPAVEQPDALVAAIREFWAST
ncbi:alpha/beta fold hydrolase [Nakamurella deserti]|uniref:alpha/beta fold hydrolase n=1 Tax=Nakamurella deserti TaxID=2164074 RepID=UPI00197B98E2|nr:alpha/beta hydrolase [Nakamurella deserti]